ncbi:hypothetical protein QA596_06345, partial [Balneolales bacterium ANBcel1]|nr:hypothetical protein [Balneolales bacterium ANBcel1]
IFNLVIDCGAEIIGCLHRFNDKSSYKTCYQAIPYTSSYSDKNHPFSIRKTCFVPDLLYLSTAC